MTEALLGRSLQLEADVNSALGGDCSPAALADARAKLRALDQLLQQVALLDAEGVEGERIAQHRREHDRLLERLRTVKLDRDRAARRAEAATRAALLDESALLQRRQEASELQRSRDVTATLRRSRQVLEEEVERMRLAIGVRHDGRAIMQRSQEAFTEYAAHSTVTNSTLDRMRRGDLTDKLLIGLGLLFFFGTVAFIVYRRVRGVIPFI